MSKHQKALPPISELLTQSEVMLGSKEPFDLQYSVLSEEDFSVLFQPWDTPLFLQRDDFQCLLTDAANEEVNKTNDQTSNGSVVSEKEKEIVKKQASKTSKLSNKNTPAGNVTTVEKNVKSVQRAAAKKCFACELCQQTFATKYALLVHRHLEHLGFSFVCPVNPGTCQKEFKSRNGLRYHVEREHANDKAAFVAGKFGELVAKTNEADSSYIAEGATYRIKKDELGSPRLVKCNSNRKGCNSSSSTSSQDESSSHSDVINAAKIDSTGSQKNSKSDIVRLQTRSHFAGADKNRGEPKEKKTGFEARYQQMYNEFSPALKQTANQFKYMKNVAEKETKVQLSQANILSKCNAGAKKKLSFSETTKGKIAVSKKKKKNHQAIVMLAARH